MTTKVKDPFMTSMALAPCSGISTDVIAAAVEIENLNLAWSSESAGARRELRAEAKTEKSNYRSGRRVRGVRLYTRNKSNTRILYRKQVEYVFYDIKKSIRYFLTLGNW